MIAIPYSIVLATLLLLWLVSRCVLCAMRKRFKPAHEFKIALVYICAAVVLRFTFFAFSLQNGQIQPLIFDMGAMFPFRINVVPLIHLLDYEGSLRDTLINVIGNTAMFIPIGVILPVTYTKLDSFKRVALTGFCISLCIELVQLPIASRVSDVDDLLLNVLGCCIGYGVYAGVRKLGKAQKTL